MDSTTTPMAIPRMVPRQAMAEHSECLRHPGLAVNVVLLVGHNTVRGTVLGAADGGAAGQDGAAGAFVIITLFLGYDIKSIYHACVFGLQS